MRNQKGQFVKGYSGNAAGRPVKRMALIDVLLKALERKKSGRQYKTLICDKLVDLAVNALEEGDKLRAIDKIFSILQRDHEFSKQLDIEERISEIEEVIREARREKEND